MGTRAEDLQLGTYQWGWHDEHKPVFEPKRGLSEDVVREISALKDEPKWMLDLRLKSLKHFQRRPMPEWGGDLSGIDFDNIFYFVRSTEQQATTWDELPAEIKETYDRLGLPEAEKQRLVSGIAAQYECLSQDTRVWTANRGLVAIKDIDAGDQVFALDEDTGSFVVAPVRGGAQTDVRQTYKITVDGRTIRATDNHPILTDGSWKTVGALRVGDLVAVPEGDGVLTEHHAVEAQGQSGVATLQRVELRLGFARVTAIEPGEVEPVYDIEVDGPHNFIAEGMVVHNSEVVYHKVREDLEAQGVIFLDTDTALKQHPDLFREHYTKVIPANDNKFAALNTAVWSGGSFIWVPEGVKVDIPLQAYFRINQQNMGQFERTLIIAEPGSYVHYVEGCTAPVYSSDSLHSAVVEIIAKPGARVRYTTIQNWSNNVYNLVTKRAAAYEDSVMEWVDANIGCLAAGSRVTTRGGVKPIEEVTPGEEVLSFDESRGELCFRRVVAKRNSGEQPVREVRVGQRRIRVTDNHPFYSYVYDPDAAKKLGRYALAYVRADQLEKAIVPITSVDYGEPHKLIRPETTAVFEGRNQYAQGFTSSRSREPRLVVPEETTDDLMWLFGLFAGDGSISGPRAANGRYRYAQVTFSVPREDRARERLIAVMDELMPGVRPTERRDGVTLTWNSVELADFLEANGFTSGAREKRVPAWVVQLPESQRLSFIAGYLDADGCASKGRRGFALKSVSRELLEDAAEVLTSLGIRVRLHTEFDAERQVEAVGRQVTARGAHRLDFPADARLVGHVSEALRQAVEAQVPAKLQHFRMVGRSSIELPETVEIHPVEVSDHVGTVPTWDIEVEGTGNFVAEGFIVHNSKLTMKYPAVWLMGRGARGEVLSVAYAGDGQHQDAGAKMVHHAPDTSSTIVSKSVSKGVGRTSYRGLVDVQEGANRVKSNVVCDALLLDETARSDTYPYMTIREDDAQIGHEASVSKVGDEQLFYLQSRGIEEFEALAMIVRGFIEPISKELPMEYAVELNRLISLSMEGAVG